MTLDRSFGSFGQLTFHFLPHICSFNLFDMAETNASQASPGPTRDPITCHVLDQVTGRPAANVSVSLTLIKPLGPSTPATASTNSDGRITNWNVAEGPSIADIFSNLAEHEGGKMVWSLKFDTGSYFGQDKTFFPEVEVRFWVDTAGGHYHVPLLLGPYSYTTYRGS